MSANMTVEEVSEISEEIEVFESRVAVLVAVTFSITFIVGIVGNSMVALTIIFQKKMRSTTNILILNLAIANLTFVILCVPTTALNIVLEKWLFGDLGCRVKEFASYVTCYVSMYFLVLMSYDRYVAINSLCISATRNKAFIKRASIFMWTVVLILNIPQLYLYRQHEYTHDGVTNKTRTVCISKFGAVFLDLSNSEELREQNMLYWRVYCLLYFVFGYVLPFMAIIIIYSMIMRILCKSKGQQVNKNKSKITFMVVVVVASFVLCWTPLHIMLFLQHVVSIEFTTTHYYMLFLSNCIAYSNMSVNPIIYGFSNVRFREAYANLLRCNNEASDPNRRSYKSVGTQSEKVAFKITPAKELEQHYLEKLERLNASPP